MPESELTSSWECRESAKPRIFLRFLFLLWIYQSLQWLKKRNRQRSQDITMLWCRLRCRKRVRRCQVLLLTRASKKCRACRLSARIRCVSRDQIRVILRWTLVLFRRKTEGRRARERRRPRKETSLLVFSRSFERKFEAVSLWFSSSSWNRRWKRKKAYLSEKLLPTKESSAMDVDANLLLESATSALSDRTSTCASDVRLQLNSHTQCSRLRSQL